MKTGMLWFDNDPKTDLPTKISRAAAYYEKKYGQMPDVCFVHPTMIGAGVLKSLGIDVRPTRQVLPHHFWLGVMEPLPSSLAG